MNKTAGYPETYKKLFQFFSALAYTFEIVQCLGIRWGNFCGRYFSNSSTLSTVIVTN